MTPAIRQVTGGATNRRSRRLRIASGLALTLLVAAATAIGQISDDALGNVVIERQGYFDPAFIGELVEQYSRPGFKLDLPFESDLLMIVLSFGIFLEAFDLPSLN